jgi:hypothetical protein
MWHSPTWGWACYMVNHLILIENNEWINLFFPALEGRILEGLFSREGKILPLCCVCLRGRVATN